MVSPIGSLVSLNQNSEQPNVNPNRFHTLKSAISSLAVIETTRLVACIGVAFFGYTSKLIPAALCLTLAAITCILKNRVTKLDVKNPEEGQVSKPLSRSASIISRISTISNRSNIARGSSNALSSVKEETPQTIKEVFLNSIVEDRVDNKPQWHDKLAVCYLFLLQKKEIENKENKEMPDNLNRPWTKDISTIDYLLNKIHQHEEKGTVVKTWKQKIKIEEKDEEGNTHIVKKTHYDLETKASEDEKRLLKATPSEIMEIIEELYEKIGNSESKQKNKDHFSKNAEHAREYIAQLKTFEMRK
ncbi:MAG: hypothetical protein ACRDDW_00560 [Candidatus Rhabdochlamydia sp.]